MDYGPMDHGGRRRDAVSERTYLSIGDVLALLRREFPDITISKIRFLESQGLVDPERTPSGYRKFYDHDVERLRWVLRQQREHFLPLKVIKGRLEQESAGGDRNGRGHEPEAPAAARARRDDARDPGGTPGAAGPAAALVGGSQWSASGGGGLSRSPRPAPPGPPGASAHRSASGGNSRGESPGAGAEGRAEAAVVTGPASGSPPAEATQGEARRPPAGGRSRPDLRREDRSSDAQGEHPGGGPHAVGHATAPRLPAATGSQGDAMSAFQGASMTLEELANASGLEPGAVADLASYGLIAGRVLGGVTYYDEDALVVGRMAAAFAQYGVEPRHLRLHLLAAQREAGFVEQIVLPLLKQRNPASRQRANETVAELSRLGQELRAVLLRRSVRALLGG